MNGTAVPVAADKTNPASVADWRTITDQLSDPKQRRGIVTKNDTDEINHLKTKNAYARRKKKLLNNIKQKNNQNNQRNPSDSRRSSHCSELNFANEDGPSTPPPTLHHNQQPNQSNRKPTTKAKNGPIPNQSAILSSSDSDSGPIDMGDYENRIRASSAFWRKRDGMCLAEKIIYYRNWKYRNMPRPRPDEVRVQMDDEIETSLIDYRSARRGAKSAAIVRRRTSIGPRPVSVPVILPPIENRRPFVVTSYHGVAYDEDRLPSIEQNQLSSRTILREVNELHEYNTVNNEEETIAETEIDNKEETTETKETEIEKTEEQEKTNDDKEETKDKEEEEHKEEEKQENEKEEEKPSEEPPKEEEPEPKDEEPKPEVPGNDPKKPEEDDEDDDDPSNPNNPNKRQKAPPPNSQPDRLIGKLDKRVEKDLRALQGHDAADDGDDDDTDVDDDTMHDLLHGERSKQLDNFLKAHQ